MSTAVESLSDYEIERGKPMPSLLHAVVQSRIMLNLDNHYGEKYFFLPELSINSEGRPMVPDIAIYPTFEIDWQNDVIKQEKPPLATIEILSPRQNLADLNDKARCYFEMGVVSCWIVLPSMEAIAVNHPAGKYKFFSGHETLVDEKIKVELPLSEVFK